ncbi:MAG: lipase family protein [Verrucomicrobiota bacterium]
MNLIRICLAGAVLNFGWTIPAMSADARAGTYFNESGLKRLATMQQHCSWVSKPTDKQVRENLESAGFSLLGHGVFGGGPSSGARAYVATRGDVAIVVFRGTMAVGLNYFQNVATDARPIPRGLVLGDAPRMENVKVHNGFQRDYNKLRPKILEALGEAKGKRLFLTGHSLGAALATICAFDLCKNHRGNFASISSIVSGSPRVGDQGFRSAFSSVAGNHLRVAIHGDPITKTPGKLGVHDYTHVGRILFITNEGTLIGSNPGEDSKRRPVHARAAYFNAVNKLVGGAEPEETVEVASIEPAQAEIEEVAESEEPEEKAKEDKPGLLQKIAAKKAEKQSEEEAEEEIEPEAASSSETKLSWKEKRASKKAAAEEEAAEPVLELAEAKNRNREERKTRPRR